MHGLPTLEIMALTIRHWQPAYLAKRKKAPTICDRRWEKFKADINWFHRFDLLHTEILSVLKKKHDFEPTLVHRTGSRPAPYLLRYRQLWAKMNEWGLCNSRVPIRCTGSGLSWTITSDIDILDSDDTPTFRSPHATLILDDIGDDSIPLETFWQYSTANTSSSEMDLDRVRMRRPGGLIRDEIWLRMMRLWDRFFILTDQLLALKTMLASGGGTKVSETIDDDLEYSGPEPRRATMLDCKEQIVSRHAEALHLMQAWLSSFERMDPASLIATLMLVICLSESSRHLANLHRLDDDEQSEQYVKARRIHLDAAGTLVSIRLSIQKPEFTHWLPNVRRDFEDIMTENEGDT